MSLWSNPGLVLLMFSCANVSLEPKQKVYVAQYGHDSIGETLAYQLREEIGKSTRYVISSESAADLKIELVSADLGESQFKDRGISSAISFVFTVKSSACAERDWLFLKQGVYITGNERVLSTAKGILAALDSAMNETALTSQ